MSISDDDHVIRRQPFDSTAKLLVEADPAAWLALAGLPADRPAQSPRASTRSGPRLMPCYGSGVESGGSFTSIYKRVGIVVYRSDFTATTSCCSSASAARLSHWSCCSVRAPMAPHCQAASNVASHGETCTSHSDTVSFVHGSCPPTRCSAVQSGRCRLRHSPSCSPRRNPRPSDASASGPSSSRSTTACAPNCHLREPTSFGPPHYLLGLRYSETIAARLTRGIWNMWDSKTYREPILAGEARGEARGQLEASRRFLMRFAERSLGPAPATAQAILAAIDDVDRLDSWPTDCPAPRPGTSY